MSMPSIDPKIEKSITDARVALSAVMGKPSAAVVPVTPTIASRWLDRNRKNRKFKAEKIEQYRRDMAAGRWQITGEAIKFDSNGDLIDGQNRLTALVQADVTLPLFVVRGLAPESQEVMDSGAPRTASDALALRGYPNTKTLATTVATYQAWTTGFYRSAMHQGALKLTHSEVCACAEADPGLVASASFASTFARTLQLPSGAIGTAHYLFSDIDMEDSSEFFGRIRDLHTAGRGDPVNTLIKRVAESRDRRERFWPATALFFLFRSWNAFRRDEQFVKFQLGSPRRGWVKIPEPR